MRQIGATKIGAAILGIEQDQPKEDLFGYRSWIVNALVACRVLTGVDYPDILADDYARTSIMHAVDNRVFNFSLPTRELNVLTRGLEWATGQEKLRAYETAYRAVFYASAAYHDVLGRMPVAGFCAGLGALNTLLANSVLRAHLPWHPHPENPPEAVQWFFLTMTHGPVQRFWQQALDVDPIRMMLPYVGGFAFFLCRQDVLHVHGLVRMNVPCRLGFIRYRLRTVAGLNVEILRSAPGACIRYMQNQTIAEPAVFPHGGVLNAALLAKGILEQHLAGALRRPLESQVGASLRDGVPWYVLKRVIPFLGPAARKRFRMDGRNARLSIRRTWDVAVDVIAPDELPRYTANVLARFGIGAARCYKHATLGTWAGQPVLICMNHDDFADAVNVMTRNRWPITNIIHVAE
jgi:hypothetical protein